MIAEKEKWFSSIISVSDSIDCILHMRRCIFLIGRVVGSGMPAQLFPSKVTYPSSFEFAHICEYGVSIFSLIRWIDRFDSQQRLLHPIHFACSA